jgi:hypothetical protein
LCTPLEKSIRLLRAATTARRSKMGKLFLAHMASHITEFRCYNEFCNELIITLMAALIKKSYLQ